MNYRHSPVIALLLLAALNLSMVSAEYDGASAGMIPAVEEAA